MARLRFDEGVVLDGEVNSVARDKLVTAMRRLRDTPEAGKPLHGNLAGCRSIRVGGSESRLVYRYTKSTDELVVLAIGPRRNDEVYVTAARRYTY